jgi:hypothetical protein
LAEAVEEVRAIESCATIDPTTCACGNIDSTKSRIMNHCFKSFELREFFNSLGYEQTSSHPTSMSALPPKADILMAITDFRL